MDKHLKKGFTLVELLAVVLLIGILAALAFPQYEKALFKAKLMKGLPAAKHILDEAEVFYLANGYFPTAEELDIEEGPENGSYAVYCVNGNNKQEEEASDCAIVSVSVSHTNYGRILTLFLSAPSFEDASWPRNQRLYMAAQIPQVQSLTNSLCRSLGGQLLPNVNWAYSW